MTIAKQKRIRKSRTKSTKSPEVKSPKKPLVAVLKRKTTIRFVGSVFQGNLKRVVCLVTDPGLVAARIYASKLSEREYY